MLESSRTRHSLAIGESLATVAGTRSIRQSVRMLGGASVPNTMVYDETGATEIGRADVVTRHSSGGAITGAMCFHDDHVALASTTVMIEVPVEITKDELTDQPAVRALSDEEVLTSKQPVRFRVVGGAPPLFLIEAG